MTPLDKSSRDVTRLTMGELGGTHGKDKFRRLVATLQYGDLITLRPQGTRRAKTVALVDVYSYAIRCEANKTKMEKVRAAKEKIAIKKQERRSKRIITGGLST